MIDFLPLVADAGTLLKSTSTYFKANKLLNGTEWVPLRLHLLCTTMNSVITLLCGHRNGHALKALLPHFSLRF